MPENSIVKNTESVNLFSLFVEEGITELINQLKSHLFGFFIYGEIGINVSGKCDFYKKTYTLVKIKNK
jgi:hypothetical protein